MVKPKFSYTSKDYEHITNLFKAIANEKRLEILNTIADTDVTVNELSKALGIRKSNTSQHLKILRLTGLVKSRRQGKSIFYRTSDPKVVDIFAVLNKTSKK